MMDSSHVCRYCQVKTYARLDNFKRHEADCFANPDRRSFVCEVCQKTFVRNDNLRRHQSKLHKFPELQPVNDKIDDALTKYLSGNLEIDKLFVVVKSVKHASRTETTMQSIFHIRLTRLAKQIGEAGYVFKIMSDLLNFVMSETKFRTSSDLCQLIIEHSSLDYPISSGMTIGKELDVNNILKRVIAVSQSERLFDINDDNSELIFSLFEKKL